MNGPLMRPKEEMIQRFAAFLDKNQERSQSLAEQLVLHLTFRGFPTLWSEPVYSDRIEVTRIVYETMQWLVITYRKPLRRDSLRKIVDALTGRPEIVEQVMVDLFAALLP